jgi:hypothetical protein
MSPTGLRIPNAQPFPAPQMNNHSMAKKVCEAFSWQYKERLNKFFVRWKKQILLGNLKVHKQDEITSQNAILRDTISQYLDKVSQRNQTAFQKWKIFSQKRGAREATVESGLTHLQKMCSRRIRQKQKDCFRTWRMQSAEAQFEWKIQNKQIKMMHKNIRNHQRMVT